MALELTQHQENSLFIVTTFYYAHGDRVVALLNLAQNIIDNPECAEPILNRLKQTMEETKIYDSCIKAADGIMDLNKKLKQVIAGNDKLSTLFADALEAVRKADFTQVHSVPYKNSRQDEVLRQIKNLSAGREVVMS